MLPPEIGGLREEILGRVAAFFDLLKADLIVLLIFQVASRCVCGGDAKLSVKGLSCDYTREENDLKSLDNLIHGGVPSLFTTYITLRNMLRTIGKILMKGECERPTKKKRGKEVIKERAKPEGLMGPVSRVIMFLTLTPSIPL